LLGGSSRIKEMKPYIETLIKNNLTNQDINVSLALPIQNLKVKGMSENDKFLDIWHDLILSTGVALKDFIE
jgi:hypothetical protein